MLLLAPILLMLLTSLLHLLRKRYLSCRLVIMN